MTTILLAEDEIVLRELLTMDLQDQGFTVHAVPDGSHAMEWLTEHTADIILLDLLMPHADGFAVMEFARERNVTAPIIILSNLSTTDQRERCLSLGAKDILIKSNLEEGELAAVINRHVCTQGAQPNSAH